MKDDFSYKAVLTSVDCQHKQFVPFHDGFLNFWQAGVAARDHMPSQTCYVCGENHPREDYVLTDCQRGVSDGYGHYTYQNVVPMYKNTDEREEGWL